MSKVVEDNKVTESKPATGRDAFAAARAQLDAQSAKPDQEPEPVAAAPDNTPTETPVQEPATAADEPTEPAPTEDTILTADELAKLSPKERQQADKWQAKLTQKSQELAAKRRELDQWQPLIESWQEDPKATVEKLARQLGISLQPTQDTTVKQEIAQQFTNAVEALPEEYRPMFQPFAEAIANKVLQSVEEKLKPIVQSQTQLISEAAAAETAGEVRAFEAKHPDFKKHEPEMLNWMRKFQPGDGVTTGEYMEAAYQAVTANLQKAEQVKATVARINKSAESVEPHTPGVSEGRVEQTMPANWGEMNNRERIRAAFEAAGKGINWKK